jgi:hypothetical protein
MRRADARDGTLHVRGDVAGRGGLLHEPEC